MPREDQANAHGGPAAPEAAAPPLAGRDPVTGLPNRHLVLDRLRALVDGGSGTPIILLTLDLDRFGALNEAFGHAVGDAVLAEVGVRLAAAFRPDDVVGRIGSDQFLVATSGRGRATVDEVARRAQIGLLEPVVVDGRDLVVSACIGTATTDTRTDVAALLGHAEAAIRGARFLGPGSIAHHDADERADHAARRALEHDLAAALEREQLVVHYQPCVDLVDGRIRGFEALVRWNHPDRGLVEPEAFVGIAEDSGLIGAIDAWVLERACADLASWTVRRPPRLHVSVNLSAHRLVDPGLARATARSLTRHAVPANALWLELTETAAVVDDVASRTTMRALQELGVQFMLDDFGTGYASLAYLKRFAVDHLKIDRTFTAGLGEDPGDEAIVDAVLAVAERLGLGVVAEGVATEVQRRWLRDRGCRLVQGSLFSGPLPATRIAELLSGGGTIPFGSDRPT